VALLQAAFAALAGFDEGAAPPEDAVRRWVRAARSGDPEAARALYRAYVAKVHRTVRGICRDDAEAEDVTQETFARALEALDAYEARADARFVSWLLAIAMNVARKRHRRRRRTVVTAPEQVAAAAERDEAPSADPAGDALDREILKRALLAALETLDPREREVVTLRYGGGLNAKEIAEHTGLGHAHVRKIAQRARDRLRARIERSLAPRAHPGEEAR
jgi:RNA polymerase sigma-70 factor (ECF subfamily)